MCEICCLLLISNRLLTILSLSFLGLPLVDALESSDLMSAGALGGLSFPGLIMDRIVRRS